MKQLVRDIVVSHLGHQNLDLHRLHLVSEYLAEHLRVAVGQAARVDIVAAVLKALEVCSANTSDA